MPFKFDAIAQDEIAMGEAITPLFAAFEGDNEIAIFDAEIGSYEFIVVNKGSDTPFELRRETFSDIGLAFQALHEFLTSEYGGA